MDLLPQIAAVLMVFALLGACLFVLRRKQLAGLGVWWKGDVRSGNSRRMEVLERVALTPQHMLCLVQVDGETILVATAPGNCQILQTKGGATS
jgi:flagellar biogenesis protein FliO